MSRTRHSTYKRTPYLLEIDGWGVNESLERRGRAPPSEVAQDTFEYLFSGFFISIGQNPSFRCCMAHFGDCGILFMNKTRRTLIMAKDTVTQ